MTNEVSTPTPTLDEQIAVKQAEIAVLEAELAEATAEVGQVAATGDIAALIAASMKVAAIQAPTGEGGRLIGKLPTQRNILEGLQRKAEEAAFNAKWDAVNAPFEQERERIKALFTAEVKALCVELGYTKVSFDVDGFASDTDGVNVSLRRAKASGAPSAPKSSATSTGGTRAPRNAKWSNGTETFDSALDVVKAHGLEWAQTSNLKGDPSKGFEADAAGWAAQRIAYAKDASNLAREHGFSPVIPEATAASAS